MNEPYNGHNDLNINWCFIYVHHLNWDWKFDRTTMGRELKNCSRKWATREGEREAIEMQQFHFRVLDSNELWFFSVGIESVFFIFNHHKSNGIKSQFTAPSFSYGSACVSRSVQVHSMIYSLSKRVYVYNGTVNSSVKGSNSICFPFFHCNQIGCGFVWMKLIETKKTQQRYALSGGRWGQ